MNTKISSEEAQEKYGIYTDHEIIEGTEIRFRLKSEDGTAYIRTENFPYGRWQKSHYHEIKETYIIQKGWIACAKLINGKIEIKKYSRGDIFTINSNEPHNIYTSANSIFHTLKHGESTDNKWHSSEELDVLTKDIKENELTEFKKQGKYILSEEYRHFDKLIWQLPAWSNAVFAAIISVFLFFSKESNIYNIKEILMVISLVFFSTTYYVLYKYRVHRGYSEYHNRPEIKSLSAQYFLQFFLGLLYGTILYIISTELFKFLNITNAEIYLLSGCFIIIAFITYITEKSITHHKIIARYLKTN